MKSIIIHTVGGMTCYVSCIRNEAELWAGKKEKEQAVFAEQERLSLLHGWWDVESDCVYR